MYKYVSAYVTSCVTRSAKNEEASLMEMDAPFYSFEKVSMDVSAPYPEMSRGNIYIVGFVDWLTNLVEAYVVKDKTA